MVHDVAGVGADEVLEVEFVADAAEDHFARCLL